MNGASAPAKEERMMDKVKLLCQRCLKELEPPFETERQLCHLCNVISEVEFEKSFYEDEDSEVKISEDTEEVSNEK